MKKLWIFAAAIAIVSCKSEKIDYAIISGKIDNADAKEMTLYNAVDRSFKEKIEIAEDGTFTDTIRKSGEFFLYQAKNMTPLYLNSGDNVVINYDSKDHKSSLSITGSDTSNYLIAKRDKEREIMGEGNDVYKLGEVDYKKTIYDVKTALENLIVASKLDDSYKSKEKRNIYYAYLGKLNMYKSYHSYYAKKKDFEPSKEFLTELNDLDYTNEEDYKEFSNYKSLVSSHYNNKAKEIASEDDQYGTLAMFKICTDIESQIIKNDLIYNNARFNITYTPKLEEFYTAFKAAGSTDEKNNAEIEKSYLTLKKLAKGSPSPTFKNYENYKGGTTSLDDLKGKYVYIDVWATWCGPCKAEIPFLKKVEKQYHNKNIEFLSVSIDTKKDHQKWKDMVKEKELGGIQLFADNDWNSQFIKDYLIKGIPKFILLDPQGNIVTANAPRPSNKALVDLFNELKI